MSHPRPHTSAGQKAQPSYYRFQTQDYDQFHVIYVSSGKLVFSSKNGDMAVRSGGMVLLREGSEFALHTEEEGYSGVCFVATGANVPEYRGPSAALVADAEARQISAMMEEECLSPQEGSEAVLKGLGQALGWRAIRLYHHSTKRVDRYQPSHYWTERARQVLEATLYAGKSAREAVSSLKLSFRQLSRHFMSAMGVSLKQYQIQIRIREAQWLLHNTSMPVTAIAYELGYSSSQHFATQFRAVTGESPSSYRGRLGE